jgi:hypothetical protein
MNEQVRAHKKRLLLSGTLVGVFLVSFAYASIAGRWGSFRGLLIYPIAFIIWMIWIIHFGWMLSKCTSASGKKIYLWVVFVGSFLASVVAIIGVCQFGIILRNHEMEKSVNSGLQEDCMKLLLNWPVKDDRIYDHEPEFSKLPSSIRMFAPVYVTNDSVNDTNTPPNIGLCKNGWGGFALGIRVFQSDTDADKFIADMKITMHIDRDFGCKRIAPGIYFWWQDT